MNDTPSLLPLSQARNWVPWPCVLAWPCLLGLLISGCIKNFGTGGTGELVIPRRQLREINGTDLIQILLNLTINALQCSSDAHRVEIYGRCLTQPIDVAQFPDGPETQFINREGLHNLAPLLAVSVQDNGPGIAPDLLPRIFQPFFTTKETTKGTGLGLAIVHRFVKEGRGAIHLQTKVGSGTTFTVYLPAHDLSGKR